MPLAGRNISHHYGLTTVLHDIDISITPEQTVALMGPSGSGKSTLLAILGGLLRPSAGKVEIDGRPIPSHPHELASLFSWVFQSINTLGRRSALDNVIIPLCAKGWTRSAAEAAGRPLLEGVGLGALSNAAASTLSGGELQRVCIARALSTRPRFVLADEPTGQLDRQTSSAVLDTLWENKARDTGMILATHDADLAARCDITLRLADGRLAD